MVGDNSKQTTTKLGRNKGIPKAQLGFSLKQYKIVTIVTTFPPQDIFSFITVLTTLSPPQLSPPPQVCKRL